MTGLLLSLALLTAAPEAERPNVVVILCDDLGFSDIGCYGGEIETPALDRLASDGLRYRQFYNTGRCWPTRAALMTGYYAQSVRRDVIDEVNEAPKAGNRGTRPSWAPLIAQTLKDAGYRTYHSGKWHLDGKPLASGFDRSYYFNRQGQFFGQRQHYLDGAKLPDIDGSTGQKEGYYVTDVMAGHAIDFLADHDRQTAEREAERPPFFLYLAFTAPHFPLHARPDDIAKYDGRYGQGWDAIRQRRHDRQQALGVFAGSLSDPLAKVGSPYGFVDQIKLFGPGELDAVVPWTDLTEVQRQFQAAKMEVHAAMVDRMDQQIGRLVAQLRRTDQLDNTLLMFLSDNGASAELMVRGDGHDPEAPPGSALTHLCLGPGWSTAANTPFAYHKTWTHEGGIATPLVVHWPARISQRGAWRDQPGHVIDLFPTILDVCGIADPAATDEAAPPRPGRSLAETFAQNVVRPRELWWSHEQNRAYRDGYWKIVRARPDRSETGTGDWELYNLAIDRSETDNVADRYPERVKALAAKWTAQNARCLERATSRR